MNPETKPVVHFSGSPRMERIGDGKWGSRMSYAVSHISSGRRYTCQHNGKKRCAEGGRTDE